jgi:DNA polymerase-3 subunit alpha
MYSILDGFGSPEDNVKRAKTLGLKALSISDHGNIAGAIEHEKACKKHKIKCIRGVELYIPYLPTNVRNNDNRRNYHMVIWSKNKQG